MPDLEFVAEPRPSAARCGDVEALDLTNPFATHAYVEAESSLTGAPWLFGCQSGGRLAFGCFGFLRSGRLNKALSIPSLPVVADSFWAQLGQFCAQQGVSTLEINTFGSPAGATIATLGRETARASRHEFVVPLTPGVDPLTRIRINHQQSLRKGIKLGLTSRVVTDPAYLDSHLSVIGDSLQRRSDRGETVSHDSSTTYLKPFLRTGNIVLFQALLGEEVVSSMTVAIARNAGYLHTAGTSPTGMASGASHFLLYEILKSTQARGAAFFNMGGVGDPESGLAKYKRYFGAEAVALESASFDLSTPLNKLLNQSARAAQQLVSKLRGR